MQGQRFIEFTWYCNDNAWRVNVARSKANLRAALRSQEISHEHYQHLVADVDKLARMLPSFTDWQAKEAA